MFVSSVVFETVAVSGVGSLPLAASRLAAASLAVVRG